MKKTISLLLVTLISMFAYSRTRNISVSSGSEITIIGDKVYIDGKNVDEYLESIEERLENSPAAVSEPDESNVYRSKNVDQYNKWYNTRGKSMIKELKEKRSKKMLDVLIATVLCIIGALVVWSIGSFSVKIKYKYSNSSKGKGFSNSKSTNLEEIPNSIKN